MAFTYTVTGAVGSKVLTVTSPDNVTIDIRAGAVRLTQDGSTYETVAALTDFGVGGIPVQTIWNGVAAANVVPDNYALGNATFLGLFANGAILEANATGMTSGEWTTLSQNLVKLADESLADLTLTNVQFSEFNASSSNVAALDPVLSNVSTDVAKVTAIGYSVGATINASAYDLADFNLVGSTFSDTITGGAGNDNIYNTTGDTGADQLAGGAGNDTITGGSGNDTITGGADADKIVVDFGTDVITDLGVGNDILVVQAGAGATATVLSDWTATAATQNLTAATITLDLNNGVDVNLRAATATSGGYTITADGNSAASIVVGSTNNDVITGGSANDELRGAAGDDVISGGVGNDAIYGGAGANNLTGGAGADTFTLNGTTDTVTDLGVGADVLAVTGTTTVVNAAVTADWTATAASSHIGGGTVTLTLGHGVDVDLRAATGDHGYTIVAASTDASNVTGSNFADIITGGTANDQLRGAQGNDSITGGSGNDIIYGGAGADTIYIDHGVDLVADLGNGQDNLVVQANAGGVTATVVSDWTATSATQNLITSGTITLDLNEGVDANLRAATATSGGYTITADGNAQASVIVGSNNADVITGGSANDELRGAGGDDSIRGGVGDDAIFGGVGANTLTGGAGADTFNLNGTTDTVTDLGVGADVLAVTGTTTVVNAAVTSDWTATASTANASVGTVTLDLSDAVDVNLRAATGAYGYTITAVGNTAASIVVGSNFADVITGGGVADELRGAQGADTINGGAGNDVLYGGADADTFQVASGADTIRDLGLGADNLVVSGSGTVVANVVADWTATATTTSGSNSVSLYLDNGVDVNLSLATGPFTVSATNNTVASNITGSNAADTINGSAAADQLRGAQGNDVINGNGGDDYISGGQGQDTLSGGQGADTFAYVSGSTSVTGSPFEAITDFNGAEDLISTGIAALASADVAIADGTASAGFDAFTAAAQVAFAAGKDVYVSFNQAGSGDALVAINNNGYADFTTGDSLIKLVGVNQASEISASNFIA